MVTLTLVPIHLWKSKKLLLCTSNLKALHSLDPSSLFVIYHLISPQTCLFYLLKVLPYSLPQNFWLLLGIPLKCGFPQLWGRLLSLAYKVLHDFSSASLPSQITYQFSKWCAFFPQTVTGCFLKTLNNFIVPCCIFPSLCFEHSFWSLSQPIVS